MRSATLTAIVLAVFSLTACSGCGAPKAETIDGKVAQALQSSGSEEGAATTSQDAAATEAQEAAPEQEPGFDHSGYGELLAEHVRYENGRVDYSGLATDRATLDRYVESFAEVELESLSRDAQLALLINAYNAFTLKLILENYGEIDSIRDLSDPWGTKRWKLGGDTLSLDDIEHGLIRPIFKDPRIHFAVNCAAIGCPPLFDEPFTGATIDEQLDRVSRDAMRNERYAKAAGNELKLTKIFDWYGEDFTKEGWEPAAETIPKWVALYAGEEVEALVEKGDPKVTYLNYDWSLNDVAE